MEIFTVSTVEPAKKPVTEGDSDVCAGQVTQERTAIKKRKVRMEEWKLVANIFDILPRGSSLQTYLIFYHLIKEPDLRS